MPELPPRKPPLAVQKHIDDLCDEFERLWLSATRPLLGDFLTRIGPEHRPALLRELLSLDCDYRREQGETPTAADYLAITPDCECLLHEVLSARSAPRLGGARPADSSTPNDLADTHTHPQPQRAEPARLPQIPGYFVLGYVAQGGMGVVYRARDEKLGREAAIKLPRSGYLSSASEKDRFLREAVAAARLRHPHICPVFEVGEAQGRPYIAMAFIRGLTLKAWRQQAQPTPRKIADLLAQIARAVQAAHDQGVVHRDLKPSNIMVEDGTGAPVLMDFGLAKDLAQSEGLTVTGDLIGTPAYMAPEQAAGRTSEVGKHSDVYSLGAILYELLAGRAPFAGALAQVLQEVQQNEPPSLRRTNAQVHRDLETICVKAMSKRPAERYASAAALADDLARFALGEPIVARRLGLLHRGWRLAARHPVVSSLALLLLLVSTLAGVAAPTILQRYRASQQNYLASQRLARISQLTTELAARLGDAAWAPSALPAADRLVSELAALSPADAEHAQRRVAQRLETFLAAQIADAAHLGEPEYAAVQAAIASLAPRDEQLAARWRERAAQRRALWITRTEVKPPHHGQPPQFHGLASSPDGSLLVSASPEHPPFHQRLHVHATREPSELNQKVAVTLDLPNGSEGGVALNFINTYQDGVGATAVSPDATQFALGSQLRGPIGVWDIAKRELLFTLAGHAGGVGGLEYSRDGKLLLSTSNDGYLKVWDVAARALLREVQVEPERLGLTEAETTLLPLAVAESPGRAYVGTLQGIEVFSLPDLKRLPPLAGAIKNIGQLSLSRDGGRLASSSTAGDVQLWELPSGKLLWTKDQRLTHAARLTLSADGRTLACESSGDALRLYDAATGALQATLHGQEGRIQAVAFDPTGQSLGVGYQTAAFKLWDVAGQRARGLLQLREQEATALRFDPQGRWLLLGTRFGLHQIDAAAVYRRWTLESQHYAFLVQRSADGDSGEVQILRSGRPLRQVVQPLAPGPVTIEAKREYETLTLQVNQNEPVRFVDYFPPDPIRGGVWGVALSSDAALTHAAASSSRAPALVSSLEQGDEQLRKGEPAAALACFEQQLAADGAHLTSVVRQEAQLKRALCLQRLNRHSEALECLQELSASPEPPTPFVALARFQWCLLLARAERWPAASALLATIQAQHPAEAAAQVVPFETLHELYDLYARGVNRRSSPLLAGSARRLESLLSFHEYLQWHMRDDGHLRWAIFEGLLVAGQEGATRELGLRIHNSLLPLLRQTKPPTAAPQGWDQHPWQRLGLLARRYNQTEPVVAALERLTLDQDGRVSAAVQGAGWELVLERARMHAARGAWPPALTLLEQGQRAFADPEATIELRLRLALLHGLVLRKLSRPEDGLAVWRKALAHPQLAYAASNLEGLHSAAAMDLIVLRGVAGEVDDLFVDQVTGYLLKRLGATGGAGQVVELFPITAEKLAGLWRSPRGLECAEQIARGDLLQSEQIKLQLMLYVHQHLRDGAFADATPAEDELLWNMERVGFECYVADELSLATFLQLGLAWKGVPPPLGWTVVFFGVPTKIKGSVAYALARRHEQRGQARSAATLYKMAHGYAGADDTLRKLADQGLSRLAE